MPNKTSDITFYVKRILGLILLLLLSCVFFYSAYTKSGVSYPGSGFKLYANDNAFDNFQWSFLDLGINSIFITGVIARMMIGFELMLGLMLLFHIYLKSFTYKAVIFILVVFIVYLGVVILKQGNTGNCGCFGDAVAMTPMAAIIKNMIMIGITLILFYLYPVKPYKFQEYVCLLLGLVAFSLPYIFNPIYTGTEPKPCHKPINLSPLYAFDSIPNVELRTGKHIISFMSLTCPHCKKAAHLFNIIHHEHPDLPIYFVLTGPKPLVSNFFKETESQNVPHLLFPSHDDFKNMIDAGVDSGEAGGVPAIYWICNDTIQYKSTYYQLDPAIMEAWVNHKDFKLKERKD